ncbi:MAG: hypothetical protein MJ175_09120 [Clostridia bacterium]|nr:hypothetical protein [Clostridia bacterium]
MNKLIECLENRVGNYIFPFFWQHGEDDDRLIEEIEAIYQSGIRALCVESRTHEQFCEDPWWHTMDVILGACKERGMKVWLLDDKHFPSGYANGIIAKKYPDQKMWGITERHMDVVGPQKDASVMYQWKTSAEDILLGIYACRRVEGEETLTGDVIDLTDKVYDDMVYFDLPEGCYRIVYLFKTRSGISDGYLQYCDKLTELGGDAFIEAVYEPHYAHYRDEFGKTFAGFFADEPCFGNHARSGSFAEFGHKYVHFPYADEVLTRLEEKYGKAAKAMLPGLWFDTADCTAKKIRLAYMDVITAMYSKYFTYKLGNWCREHGVEYIGHVIEDAEQHAMTQNSGGHYFRALDGQDMAGIDVVLNQVVPGMSDNIITVPCNYDISDPGMFHFTLPKLGSSHAHIQKLKKGRAMCEIYGAYGWAEGLKMMKWLTDLMLVRGINRFVPHAFTPKFPDYDCPPHMYAGGNNPQYADFRRLMEYMNRICHINDGGVHKADAALLYHAEAYWANGRGGYESINDAGKYLTQHQMDYDIVPADYLTEAKVQDGRLCLGDETYPCLIVPGAKTLPDAIIKTVLRLRADGLPVMIVGEYPFVSETGAAVDFAAAKIPCIPVCDLEKAIRGAGMSDVQTVKVNCACAQKDLRIYHYIHGGTHFYMMTNEGIHDTVDCTLRLSAFAGGDYAVYDAMENKAVCDHSEDGCVDVVLAPYESRFFIFGDLPENLSRAEHTEIVAAYPLECRWDIFTATQAEYPIFTPYRTTDKLFNMTGRDALPRFSGHIQYEASVKLSEVLEDMRIILDLGAVGETAALLINGDRVGVRIAPPYRFDITEYVKNGMNTVTVEVTNHLGYQMRDGFSKFMIFEPSGLLGPVKVEIFRLV